MNRAEVTQEELDYELPLADVCAIGISATYVPPNHISGPSTNTSCPVETIPMGHSAAVDLDVFFGELFFVLISVNIHNFYPKL